MFRENLKKSKHTLELRDVVALFNNVSLSVRSTGVDIEVTISQAFNAAR